VGIGPVYAAGLLGLMDGILPYDTTQFYPSATWGGQKVLWVVAPSYTGPVLIRGQQLDGPHALRFDGGVDGVTLQPNLRLMGGPGYGMPWPNWPTNTRFEAPGCYAYQMDGLTFSYAIVFQAEEQGNQ
jgi:hypothetical protein